MRADLRADLRDEDFAEAERYLRGEIPGLLRRDVVCAEGSEASKFLHALLSQDVASIEIGSHRWAFLLQPQGRITAHLRVRRVEADRFELDTEAGFGESLHTALSRYLLRTKCTLRLETDVAMLRVHRNVVGPPAHRLLPGVVDRFPEERNGDEPAELANGWIVEGERIAAGFACHGSDFDESTIPNSTTLLADAVAFGKGCYVGQELVERIDSRSGSTPTRIAPVLVTQHVSVALPFAVTDTVVLTSLGTDPRTRRRVGLVRAARGVQGGEEVGSDALSVTFRSPVDGTAT